jgi:hypothetical protein
VKSVQRSARTKYFAHPGEGLVVRKLLLVELNRYGAEHVLDGLVLNELSTTPNLARTF